MCVIGQSRRFPDAIKYVVQSHLLSSFRFSTMVMVNWSSLCSRSLVLLCLIPEPMAEEGSWASRYSDVVWAKFQGFPWWPSFVYDPEKLPTTSGKEVKDKAPKLVGKQYVVYFYADGTFGFVTPKQIRSFNEETVKQLATGQKIGKKYQDHFTKAVELAKQELELPASERMSWHYSYSTLEGSDSEGAVFGATGDDVPGSQTQGRKRASSDLYFQEDASTVEQKHTQALDNDADTADEGEDEEVDVSDEAEHVSASESDFEVPLCPQESY